MQTTKEKLLEACKNSVKSTMENIAITIQSCKNDLASETKSSAGDKHETGRSMLQLEMEKAGQQWLQVQQTHNLLSKISIEPSNGPIRLGSLVSTSNGVFFLAVSIGQLKVDSLSIFVISPSAPMGRLLIGKNIGDSFIWNAKEIQIYDIA
ncbi:MAG: 3-oxoacyl-ACP synthase [Flavicella sp.]